MVGDHEVAVHRAHRRRVGAQVAGAGGPRRRSSRARARRSRRPRALGRYRRSPSRRRRSGRRRTPRGRRPSPRAPSARSRSRSRPGERRPRVLGLPRVAAEPHELEPGARHRRARSARAGRRPGCSRAAARAAATSGSGPAAPWCSTSIGWRRRTTAGATASDSSRRATRSLRATATATWRSSCGGSCRSYVSLWATKSCGSSGSRAASSCEVPASWTIAASRSPAAPRSSTTSIPRSRAADRPGARLAGVDHRLVAEPVELLGDGEQIRLAAPEAEMVSGQDQPHRRSGQARPLIRRCSRSVDRSSALSGRSAWRPSPRGRGWRRGSS